MGKSFLKALQSGEVGGFQALIDNTHAIAQEEDVARALPPTPLTLDGRVFVAWARGTHNRVTLHNLSDDDMNWALMHLGQYVAGVHPYATFRAYVAEVQAAVGDFPSSALLILEDLKRHG